MWVVDQNISVNVILCRYKDSFSHDPIYFEKTDYDNFLNFGFQGKLVI